MTLYTFEQITGATTQHLDETECRDDVVATVHAQRLANLWGVRVLCWRLDDGRDVGALFPGETSPGKHTVAEMRPLSIEAVRQKGDT